MKTLVGLLAWLMAVASAATPATTPPEIRGMWVHFYASENSAPWKGDDSFIVERTGIMLLNYCPNGEFRLAAGNVLIVTPHSKPELESSTLAVYDGTWYVQDGKNTSVAFRVSAASPPLPYRHAVTHLVGDELEFKMIQPDAGGQPMRFRPLGIGDKPKTNWDAPLDFGFLACRK